MDWANADRPERELVEVRFARGALASSRITVSRVVTEATRLADALEQQANKDLSFLSRVEYLRGAIARVGELGGPALDDPSQELLEGLVELGDWMSTVRRHLIDLQLDDGRGPPSRSRYRNSGPINRTLTIAIDQHTLDLLDEALPAGWNRSHYVRRLILRYT